ncbi:MAG: hypothetical protein WBO34_02885 [Gammaproteobacteria bacterium]
MYASRARVAGVLLLAFGLAAVLALKAQAIESAHLSLGNVAGEGWSLDDVTVQLDWTGESSARAVVQASMAQLPGQLGSLKDLQFVCESAELTATSIACTRGMLDVHSSRLGQQSLQLELHYRLRDKQVRVRARNMRIAGGRVAVAAVYRDSGWSADVRGTGLLLANIVRELRSTGMTLPALTPGGTLDLEADLSGRAALLTKSTFEVRVRADSFSDESGRYAGENLDVTLTGSARPRRTGWEVQADLTARQGAVYIDPVYVEVTDSPIRAAAAVVWSPRTRVLSLQSFAYLHPDSLQLDGTGMLDLRAEQPVRQLRVNVHAATFPSAYKHYLQPWVAGTLAGNMQMSGELGGTLEIDNGAMVRASASVQTLTLSQLDGLFGFDSLTGNLDWSDSATPEYSTLAWTAGHVYSVGIGKSQLELESTGNAVRLMRPVRIPVLDGVLDIETFSLDNPADNSLRWTVDGILTPISMQQLTRALKWQEFGGKLSGVIPSVSYADGQLVVGGVLLVRVFDGVVTLRDLQLNQPFGLVPRLQVNAAIENIDLETLTGTFSFGRIEGRLDGHVDGLLLESWRPVAFDAEFATPEDDKSRHRISQRAVENISNIGGGGVSGALSRGFLGIFKDFPYARLGIRCRLQNGVCDMGGVEQRQNGYYLVKGTFLPPRLDVVGFADRVDWNSLVAQIIAVTLEKNVVVE